MPEQISIGDLLWHCNFVDLKWDFFKRTARLFFSDTASGAVVLTVEGVRFIGFRIGLAGPEGWGLYAECGIDYAEIREDSPFLRKLMKGELGFSCRDAEGMYDSAAKSKDEPGYKRPRHFALSCDAGMLDILFEEYRIDPWERSDTD